MLTDEIVRGLGNAVAKGPKWRNFHSEIVQLEVLVDHRNKHIKKELGLAVGAAAVGFAVMFTTPFVIAPFIAYEAGMIGMSIVGGQHLEKSSLRSRVHGIEAGLKNLEEAWKKLPAVAQDSNIRKLLDEDSKAITQMKGKLKI